MASGKPTHELDKQQAVKLASKGETVSEIARRLELSRPTVRKILKG